MLWKTIFILLAWAGPAAYAETIYRCGNAYSDEPCKGGAVVDVLPTEGAHSLSGKKRIGHDATMREAWRTYDKTTAPVTGVAPEENARRREERRHQKIPRIPVEQLKP